MAKKPKKNGETAESKLVADWLDEISIAKQDHSSLFKDSDKVYKEYLSERGMSDQARMGLFFTSIEILKPLIFAATPVPVCTTKKSAGRIKKKAAEIWEDLGKHYIERKKQNKKVFEKVRDSFLIPGRGVAICRFRAKIEEVEAAPELAPPAINPLDPLAPIPHPAFDENGMPLPGPTFEAEEYEEEGSEGEQREVSEQVTGHDFSIEYVHMNDFLHNKARDWSEVRWISILHHYTKNEGKEEFGEQFKGVKCDVILENKDDRNEDDGSKKTKKAQVYEIYDKDERKIYFISPGKKSAPLKEQDWPEDMEDFPMPEPIQAVTSPKSFIPQSFYKSWQDQILACNELTDRISKIREGVRVTGVCDQRFQDTIEKMLTSDMTLHPIAEWASFLEKNGLSGSAQLMEIEPYVKAINTLYEARNIELDMFYQTSGISDLMRGVTDAGETLGAQQMKERFSSSRIADYQRKFQDFCREAYEVLMVMIANHCTVDMVLEHFGEELEAEGFTLDDVTQIVRILNEDRERDFVIDIETNSTIALNEADEQSARMEALTTTSQFFANALPILQNAPSTSKTVFGMLKFAFRTFRASRSLESDLDESIATIEEEIRQAKEAEQQQPPDPKIAEIEAKTQLEQMRMANEVQLKQSQMEMDREKFAMNHEIELMKAQTAQIEAQAAMKKVEAEIRKMQVDSQIKGVELASEIATNATPINVPNV